MSSLEILSKSVTQTFLFVSKGRKLLSLEILLMRIEITITRDVSCNCVTYFRILIENQIFTTLWYITLSPICILYFNSCDKICWDDKISLLCRVYFSLSLSFNILRKEQKLKTQGQCVSVIQVNPYNSNILGRWIALMPIVFQVYLVLNPNCAWHDLKLTKIRVQWSKLEP